jgi:hypothetical protein
MVEMFLLLDAQAFGSPSKDDLRELFLSKSLSADFEIAWSAPEDIHVLFHPIDHMPLTRAKDLPTLLDVNIEQQNFQFFADASQSLVAELKTDKLYPFPPVDLWDERHLKLVVRLYDLFSRIDQSCFALVDNKYVKEELLGSGGGEVGVEDAVVFTAAAATSNDYMESLQDLASDVVDQWLELHFSPATDAYVVACHMYSAHNAGTAIDWSAVQFHSSRSRVVQCLKDTIALANWSYSWLDSRGSIHVSGQNHGPRPRPLDTATDGHCHGHGCNHGLATVTLP